MFIYDLAASDYTELLSSVANWTYFGKEKTAPKDDYNYRIFFDKWRFDFYIKGFIPLTSKIRNSL